MEPSSQSSKKQMWNVNPLLKPVCLESVTVVRGCVERPQEPRKKASVMLMNSELKPIQDPFTHSL
jgi:hypothetical protein